MSIRLRRLIALLGVVGALLLAQLALLTITATPASAAACNLYASPTGNDANSGTTPATALASPVTLLNRLAAGQVGCLEDGASFVLGGGEGITSTGGTVSAPKTLRPTTPGARATITTATGLWLQAASHDLVLQDLDIRRNQAGGGSLFLVDGDRITLNGVDLTYPNNICLDVGEDSRAGSVNPTEDFTLINSRVHDCGSSYGPPHTVNDSGVHGIYLQFLRDGSDADTWGAVLRNNVIDHNHNRGVQLYPDAHNVLVTHNVLASNGANLNLGSEPGSGVYSTDNVVRDNIIVDSVLDGLEAGGFVGDTSEVLGNFPQAYDARNRVDNNCVSNSAHPDHLYEGYGFTQTGNTDNVAPIFVDAANGDYRQTAASPCLGRGLEQPTATLGKATTDNYKWVYNGDPNAPTETRTSLLFDSITVGSTVYVVDQAKAPGDAVGTPKPAPAGSPGIPLKVAATGVSDTFLVISPVPESERGCCSTSQYRIFSGGEFGPWIAINRTRFPTHPVDLTLKLVRNGTVIAVNNLRYSYDPAVAAMPSSTLEYKGPGGRWSVAAAKTPLNWPSTLGISPTRVTAGTSTALRVTPRDNIGLTVPMYDEPIALAWNPSGAGRPTSAPGTGVRTVTVNLPSGSYALGASSDCGQLCAPTGQATITSAAPTSGADLGVTTTEVTASALAGSTRTVTATLTNNGPATATASKATVTVPTGMALHGLSASGGTCSVATATCTFGDLASAATRIVTLKLAAITAGTRTAKVTATSTTADPVSTNNSVSVATTVTGSSCTVIGTAAGETLTGTPNADVICGFAGADTLNGLAGNDTLLGDSGNDTLDGGDNNDVMRGGANDDVITGGAGSDAVSVEDGAAPVAVNLLQQSVFCYNGSACGLGYDSPVTGVEDVRGSPFGDALIGSTGPDILRGYAGDDLVDGQDGSDTLVGGLGADSLLGRAGTDVLRPGDGNFADTVNGGDGTADRIELTDVLTGVTVDLAAGTLTGAGNDTITQVENATGSAQSDTLRGTATANVLRGGAGADVLDGRAGNDTIYSRDGVADTVVGGADSDKAQVDQGVDNVSGVETLLP